MKRKLKVGQVWTWQHYSFTIIDIEDEKVTYTYGRTGEPADGPNITNLDGFGTDAFILTYNPDLEDWLEIL